MNDERPIEKLLRRFAKKRRDEAGAPAELHPANRRQLRAEVARQFPKAQPRAGWWTGLGLLLNRKFAYAVALLAVIGVSAVLMQPTKQKEPMGLAALDAKKGNEKQLSKAMRDEEIPASATTALEAKDSYTTEPTVAAAPPVVRTESASTAADSTSVVGEVSSTAPQSAPLTLAPTSRTRSSPASNIEADRTAERRQQVAESVARYNEQNGGRAPARSDALSTPAPAERALAASASKQAIAGSVVTNAESQVFSRRYGVGRSTPAPGSVQPVNAVATGAAMAELAKTVQNFSQVTGGGKLQPTPASSRTTPVLVNFVVEQSGDQIRVTDSDGSTYTGLVQSASQENIAQKEFIARGGGLEKSRPAQAAFDSAADEARSAEAQNYLFRVVGTNRTLNQPVNFVGNFVMLTNQMSGAITSAQFADQAKNTPAQLQVLPLLQNSAIQGRLQIGSGREVELNAVPVKP